MGDGTTRHDCRHRSVCLRLLIKQHASTRHGGHDTSPWPQRLDCSGCTSYELEDLRASHSGNEGSRWAVLKLLRLAEVILDPNATHKRSCSFCKRVLAEDNTSCYCGPGCGAKSREAARRRIRIRNAAETPEQRQQRLERQAASQRRRYKENAEEERQRSRDNYSSNGEAMRAAERQRYRNRKGQG
jgi:uncharacterized Zn finger protein (UPF0148 family)